MIQFRTRSIRRSRPGYPDMVDLVAIIPPNDWVWRILDLDVVGFPFRGKPLPDLMNLVSASSFGVELSYSELTELAHGIDQTIDILIVGTDPGVDVAKLNLAAGVFERCNFIIEIFDSSEVTVGVDDDVCDAGRILGEFGSL